MSTVAHGQDPRIPALSVLSALAEPDGKDFLSMLSGKVVENIQRGTLASRLKNRNLSGNPDAGTIEARRFANSKSQAYGTARAAGRGNAVKAKPVYVHIDIDREIVEEIEHKDVIMLGVSGLLQERSVNHEKTTIRETERAFFQTASDAGMEVVPASTAIEEVLEALILQITTTLNEFVDGVDRDMLDLVLSDTFYSRARNYIDRGVNNGHVSTSSMAELAGTFDEWCNVHYHAPIDSEIEKTALDNMVELAETFNEWYYVFRCAPEGSELRQTALEKARELESTAP